MEAAKTGTRLNLHAPGTSAVALLLANDKERLQLSVDRLKAARLRPGDRVSLQFEFRGQNIVFGSDIRRIFPDKIELSQPGAIYRNPSRRWPRIARPRGLSAELLIPGGRLVLGYPECREYRAVPEARGIHPRDTLGALVDRFKRESRDLASEGRVSMFKPDRGPSNPAERIISHLGKVLLAPSTISGLPLADPYAEGRVITRSEAEDFEGVESLGGDSELGAFFLRLSSEGCGSVLYSPLIFYRYAIGYVMLANTKDRPRSLDFRSVEYAWNFGVQLVALLKLSGYFKETDRLEDAAPATVLDASPSGMLVGLPEDQPRLRTGTELRIRLSLDGWRGDCEVRVARIVDLSAERRYGLQLQNPDPELERGLSLGLYGEIMQAQEGRCV